MKLPTNIQIYGDTTFRGPCPTETAEAITFFNAIRKTPLGQIAVHIKNEGRRKHSQASWDRAQGMVKGASDIIIPGSPTCLIELKRRDHTKSKLSKEQIEYLEAAQSHGAWCCISLGWDAAWEAVKAWKSITAR